MWYTQILGEGERAKKEEGEGGAGVRGKGEKGKGLQAARYIFRQL